MTAVRTLRPGISPPFTIAHRGASEAFPENTPAAFDGALAAGCDGIELDVQLSADGVPFLYHDRTLARIGAGRRRASSHTMDALRGVDAGSWLHGRFRGERILPLADVLERYGNRTLLLVEMKVRTPADSPERRRILARTTATMIRERGLQDSTALLCYDIETLAAARAAAPQVRIVLNLKARGGRLSPSVRTVLPILWALSLHVGWMRPNMAATAHAQGLPVLAYTCNSERQVRRALECGADAIMSDAPAWLRGILSRAVPVKARR